MERYRVALESVGRLGSTATTRARQGSQGSWPLGILPQKGRMPITFTRVVFLPFAIPLQSFSSLPSQNGFIYLWPKHTVLPSWNICFLGVKFSVPACPQCLLNIGNPEVLWISEFWRQRQLIYFAKLLDSLYITKWGEAASFLFWLLLMGVSRRSVSECIGLLKSLTKLLRSPWTWK